jgi:hypothetical protein
VSSPFLLVGFVGLVISPGMISCIVFSNLGLAIGELDEFLVFLGKSWVESGVWSLLVDNPVEVISRSDVGLLGPCDFVRFVVLCIGPRMVSLGVWGDVRVAVFGWIG